MCAAVRRQPVAQGGLFSTPKASFSKETQELLKVMMKESKLTSFQQRQLQEKMQSGRPLPLRCHPTSSSCESRPAASGSKKTPRRPQPSKQGLRSKETIERTADTEPDYRPPPCRYNSSKEKEKLQKVMAYGSDLEPPAPAGPRPQEEEREESDRFDELLQEIEERREFLSEMESLGKGKNYRSKIMTEISQKIREMEVLDKQRCSELTTVLQEDSLLATPSKQ